MMKNKTLVKKGAAALLGCAALIAAYQAGRLQPVREVRVVEKETVETSVPVLVPVAIPVAMPFNVGSAKPSPEVVPVSPDDPAVEVDPNLCVQNSPDGSRVMWVRAQDRRNVAKYDFAPDGPLTFLSQLRLDENGNPLGAKIRNDRNEVIYQASYGYHKDTGTLVAELLFDKRPEAAPEHGLMVPVRRVNYGVDATGRETHEIEQPPVVMAEDDAEQPPLPSPFSIAAFPKGW